MTLSTYSTIALAAAGILPPLAAGFIAWYWKRTLKTLDLRLRQMDQVEARIEDMIAAPARIRQMAQEMRDTVTRIQETP